MEATTADPLVGRLLDGRYRLDGRIARGGMATVYDGFDTRLDRVVAVKVMRAELAENEAFVDRFRREAKAAARLSHPGVVAVYDQGEDGGYVYLVMERVSGRTLRAELRDVGRLEAGRALDITAGILAAVGAAHEAGIVHRDVKPENVLITNDGRVKVADFGLARAIEATNHTIADGTLIGTVAYLSPEQVSTGDATPRSDVYATGCVLFELLTGTPPFTGDQPVAVAYRHVNEDVPAPSSVRKGIPKVVDEVVAAATRRDPDQRYADGAAMLAAVHAARGFTGDTATTIVPLTDAPTIVTKLPARGRRGKKVAGSPAPPSAPGAKRRRKPLVIAVVLGLILGVAGGLGWWLGSGRYISVPDVIRLDPAAATAALRDAGLKAETGEPVFHDTIPVGRIADTEPDAGGRVRRGGTVTLHESRGNTVTVPDLRGKTVDEARQILSDGDLALGRLFPAYDNTVPINQIVTSNRGAGIKVRHGSTVDVTVSKGPEPFEVPNVVGEEEGDALKALAKLNVTVVREFSDDVDEGKVIGQSVPAGTRVNSGSAMSITVSRGPELVEVPDVEGKERGDVQRIIEAAGFVAAFDGFPNRRKAKCAAQDPEAGTKRRRGSTVTCFMV